MVSRGNTQGYYKQERGKGGEIPTFRMSTPVNCGKYVCIVSRTATSKAVQCIALETHTDKSNWSSKNSGHPQEGRRKTKEKWSKQKAAGGSHRKF